MPFLIVSDGVRCLTPVMDHPVISIKAWNITTQLCHSQIHPSHLDKLIRSHISLASHFPTFPLVGHTMHDIIHYLRILSG